MEKYDINDEYQQRLKKMKQLAETGINPYPANTKRNQTIADFLTKFKELVKSQKKVVLAGRIRSLRLQGGSCFLHFEDESGRVQGFVRKDNIGEEQYEIFKNNFDLGDFVEITGQAFVTKTEEPTILAESITILTKALLPLPDKHSGLADQDLRFRKRYLDLLANPEVRQVFKMRTAVMDFIRNYFNQAGFTEVDTPMLQAIASGATAQPFKTHHNALDIDLFLRVAPELYLKRLIIGGYEKVYEIARCFRNEGIDHQHNPEFTQIEAYWAYQDYQGLMEFTEKFMAALAKNVTGSYKVKIGEHTLDFTAPYPRVDFKDLFTKYYKVDIDKLSDKDLFGLAKEQNLKTDKTWGRGKLLDELYKKVIRPNIIQPTFLINHPIEISPLAKKITDRPNYVERFQLVANTAEVCNAFSELNDPLDQAERFAEQKQLAKQGDAEAQGADDEFVEALKHGMPPTAGIGIGIDRLIMLLGNVENIKEVILFPTMRPKK